MVSAGGKLYFVANDGEHGHELWSTNGARGGTTVKDIRGGSQGSSPISPTNADPVLPRERRRARLRAVDLRRDAGRNCSSATSTPIRR